MIWLIGSGPMAASYIQVLQEQKKEFLVIGRGEESAKKLEEQFSIKVIRGGLTAFLKEKPKKCNHAIVSVTVDQLESVTTELLNYQVKCILLEKPGILTLKSGKSLEKLAKKNKARVFVAYNRRYYGSVLKAKEIIRIDGGITSVNFEFTEWPHVVTKLQSNKVALKNWLFVNSSHVIDLAFHFAGKPARMKAYVGGKKKILWHPAGSIFSGAGVTKTGALFSYSANWLSPGRWVLEVLTLKHRLIFKPMEDLQVQELASVKVEPVVFDKTLDTSFKPGIYLQVKQFLEGNFRDMCTLSEQVENFKFYEKILKG